MRYEEMYQIIWECHNSGTCKKADSCCGSIYVTPQQLSEITERYLKDDSIATVVVKKPKE